MGPTDGPEPQRTRAAPPPNAAPKLLFEMTDVRYTLNGTYMRSRQSYPRGIHHEVLLAYVVGVDKVLTTLVHCTTRVRAVVSEAHKPQQTLLTEEGSQEESAARIVIAAVPLVRVAQLLHFGRRRAEHRA